MATLEARIRRLDPGFMPAGAQQSTRYGLKWPDRA